MTKPKYTPLKHNPDLCEFAIIEAIETIDAIGGRVRWTYSLHVSPRAALTSANILRRMSAQVQHNPLAPYINLCMEPTLADAEWFLRGEEVMNPARDTCVGSVGA